MTINEALLPEFDNEMKTTRAVLERVSDETFQFKPHEKSTSMGSLAIHTARIPTWVAMTINENELDLAAPRAEEPQPTTTAELVALFDKNVNLAREALSTASDETLFKSWALKSGPATLMSMPRVAVLRSFVISHMIHHRGQLSVYLRLNDIPVPAIYGPSADENPFMAMAEASAGS